MISHCLYENNGSEQAPQKVESRIVPYLTKNGRNRVKFL